MSQSEVVSVHGMAVTLLVFAFAAGIGELFRVALGDPVFARRIGPLAIPVVVPWLVLHLIITVRLAGVLGIGS